MISRRTFLKGLGGSMFAVPFLQSLSPLQVLAQTPTPAQRFLAITHLYGYCPTHYFPGYAADVKVSDDLYYKDLRTVTGPINPWLGTKLDAFKAKINLYEGLDITTGSLSYGTGHESTHAYCASYPSVYGDANGKKPVYLEGSNFASMDFILAKSRNFYPHLPKIEALRGGEQFASSIPFFERTGSGSLLGINVDRDPKILFNKAFSGSITDPTTKDQFEKNLITFGDLVLDDYKAKMASRKISSEDKNLLSNFVDYIQETQARLKASDSLPPVSCTAPSLRNITYTQDGGGNRIVAPTQHMDFMKNMVDVIVAAFACDATRIGSLLFGSWNGIGDHTDSINVGTNFVKNMQFNVDVFLYLLQRMDSFTEANGKTMLDNSLVFWTSEVSESQAHMTWSMPAVSAGSIGGKIKTGYYLDYRQKPIRTNAYNIPSPGRPYNQLLISFMSAFGLQPAEYNKYGDGGGFGRFDDVDHLVHRWVKNGSSGAYEDIRNPWLKYASVRNQPLPFLMNT